MVYEKFIKKRKRSNPIRRTRPPRFGFVAGHAYIAHFLASSQILNLLQFSPFRSLPYVGRETMVFGVKGFYYYIPTCTCPHS